MVFTSPLKDGARVAILKKRDIQDDEESAINQYISEMESEAWSAGFFVTVKSVTYSEENIVILYELLEDPSFRPPM